MRISGYIVLIGCVLLMQSCGSRSSSVEPGQPALAGTALLPAPEDLAGIEHVASVAGPGWHSLSLMPDGTPSLQHAVSEGEQGLLFDGPENAWRIWPVGGFSGDVLPTSIRAGVAQDSGEYSLGWVDYDSGRWHFSGPFSGDALVEYPLPADPVSRYGRHFIVMLAAAGSSVELTSIELGVDGGDDAPAAVEYIFDNSSQTEVAFSWTHSLSHLEPDFAGYHIERAAVGSSAWLRLTTEPQHATSYIDPDGQDGLERRYRILSADTSGNVSYSVVRQFGLSNADAAPVARIEVLPDSLFGPTTVSLDMSASYDPDGDIIEGYHFQVGDDAEVIDSAQPVLELLMQPGCYRITAWLTANGETGYTSAYLKVYPRWQDPVLIDAGENNTVTTYDACGITDPRDGSELFLYADLSAAGIAAVCVRPDGSIDRDFLPVYGTLYPQICQPVIHGGRPLAGAVFDGYLHLIEWTGDSLEYSQYRARAVDSIYCALASDGADRLWLLHYVDDDGDYSATLTELFSGRSISPATGIADARIPACVYNPAVDAVECIYQTDSLEWVRIADNSVLAEAQVNDEWVLHLDIIVRESDGRPVLTHSGIGNVSYRELNADATAWSAPVSVGGETPLATQHELLERNGSIYCSVIKTNSKLLNIFTGGAGGFTEHASFNHDMASNHALVADPQDGRFALLDLGSDGRRHCYRGDGSDQFTLLLEEDAADRQGRSLMATNGYNGINLFAGLISGARHYVSGDAVNWQLRPEIADVQEMAVGSNPEGQVLLAETDGNSVTFHIWAPGDTATTGFDDLQDDVVPTVSDQGTLTMLYQQDAVNSIHAIYGGFPEFRAWNDGILWQAAVYFDPQGSFHGYGYSGGAGITGSSIGRISLNDDHLLDPREADIPLPRAMLSSGRWLDGCSYLDVHREELLPVFMLAYGNGNNPQRIIIDGNERIHDYSFSDESGGKPDPSALERTVSMDLARGYTAAGIVAGSAGDRGYMEWSNFGEWEELPLPEIPFMSMPELVVGSDGRWHIIYHDLITDDLMVVSTP
ncbi:MAG: hypothetical protein R3F46_05965 [bacterium]